MNCQFLFVYFSFTPEPPEIVENFTDTSYHKACNKRKDFFDARGNYLKTACMVFTDKRNDEACVDDDMNLFILESKEMQRQLLAFATSVFGNYRGSTLWINGNRLSDGYWYTFDPTRKELMQGIKYVTEGVQSDSSDSTPSVIFPKRLRRSVQNGRKSKLRQSTNCLVIQAINNFTVSAWSCVVPMYSVCEYNKNDISSKHKVTTSTTTIVPTLPPVSLGICDKTQPLYNNNGDYEKSVCFVKESLRYDEADFACKSSGMKLYTKNFELNDKLFTASQVMFEKVKESVIDLWVEGRLRDVEFTPDYVIHPSDKCYSMFYDRRLVDFFMDKCVYRKAFLCEYDSENL